MPQKRRKRRYLGASDQACHVQRAEHKDHVWCWDFVFDRTTSGQTLKWLSITDEFTRESLALKIDRSITAEDVLDTLAELFACRGVPLAIRSDNGPEFVALSIRKWLAHVGVKTLYIEAGSPWQNGYAESFHSRFRDEFLAAAAEKRGRGEGRTGQKDHCRQEEIDSFLHVSILRSPPPVRNPDSRTAKIDSPSVIGRRREESVYEPAILLAAFRTRGVIPLVEGPASGRLRRESFQGNSGGRAKA